MLTGLYFLILFYKSTAMNTTQAYLQTWTEARTRFSNLLKELKQEDLTRKWWYEKQCWFSDSTRWWCWITVCEKCIWGNRRSRSAKTIIAQHDTGEWTNLQELLIYQQEACNQLKAIIEKQTDDDWKQIITTKEFGTKSKAEAIGRIISHTAYHAGQLALTLKYGTAA